MGQSKSKTENFKIKTYPIYEDYVINDEVIGTGKRGDIITCTHKRTNKKHALKYISYSNEIEKSRALNEATLHWIASKDCEHIVKVISVYNNELKDESSHNTYKAYLVVLEMIDEGTLLNRIENDKHFLILPNIPKIMSQLLLAVKHLHDLGISHRDIKVGKVLMATQDGNPMVKLSDFGNSVDTVLHAHDKKIKDQKTLECLLNFEFGIDIWALGVLWYYLYARNYPPGIYPIDMLEKNWNDIEVEKLFSDSLWDEVPKFEKSLITDMLQINVKSCVKIDEIIKQYAYKFVPTPKTPSATPRKFTFWDNDITKFDDGKDYIEIGYNNLIINWTSNSTKIKSLKEATDNKLLNKRRESLKSQLTN